MTTTTIMLKYLPDAFSIYQFERDSTMPPWVFSAPWYTLSRTMTELSVIVPTRFTLPATEVKNVEHGWRMLQVDAQMDFSLVGILASIIAPLKDNKIPVFVVSTYDTDYIMVKEEKLDLAINVLNNENAISVSAGTSVFSC